jgi:hypothetical protein
MKLLLSMVLFSVALIAGGCETMPWPPGQAVEPPPVEMLDDQAGAQAPAIELPNELPLSTEQRFKDIPLPASAKEDLARTYVYQSSTISVGRMVYTTRAAVGEIAQFYINQLPAADWHLERVTEAEGVNMIFTKPDKRLEVTIRPMGAGRGQELILHLTPEAG